MKHLKATENISGWLSLSFIFFCFCSNRIVNYSLDKNKSDCYPKRPSSYARNSENATKLWQLSEQMVNL